MIFELTSDKCRLKCIVFNFPYRPKQQQQQQQRKQTKQLHQQIVTKKIKAQTVITGLNVHRNHARFTWEMLASNLGTAICRSEGTMRSLLGD